jgi:Flp pilus assembly pilin Flp
MLKTNAVSKTSYPGNATIEYTLIGGLICVLSVAGLFALSGAFRGEVSGLGMDMKSRTIQAANAGKSQEEALRIASMDPTLNPTGAPGYDPYAPPDSGESGESTITTGSNGSQGSTGKTGGDSGSESPDLSKKEEQLVEDVANKAHDIARLQEAIEQLSAYSKGNLKLFANSSMVVDLNQMNALEIARALGDDGLVKEFEKLVSKLDESEMPDELKEDLKELSKKVKEDAKKTAEKTEDILAGTGGSPSSIPKKSDDTTENAGKICETGGGTDNGISCSNSASSNLPAPTKLPASANLPEPFTQ